MCDKQVYRQMVQDGKQQNSDQEISPNSRNLSVRDSSLKDRRQISMGSFLYKGFSKNPPVPILTLSAQETDLFAHEGLPPMRYDDRRALFAWVKAKPERDLKLSEGTD
jgi:hypothetical protein